MAAKTRQTRTSQEGGISEELLDELLAGRDAAEVSRSEELIADLKKPVAERALDAEMDVHLAGETPVPWTGGRSRATCRRCTGSTCRRS